MDLARALLSLSEQDLGIVRAEKQLDELPEKRTILEVRKKIREFESLLTKAQAYVDEAQRAVKRDEDETAALDAKIDAEQSKIISGAVTNPKELQNLSRELDALRRRKDKLENTTISIMEKVEAGQAQVATVAAAIQKAHEREEGLIAEFQAKGGALQRDIAAMKARRDAVSAALPADMLGRYERARQAKHGVAVGTLQGEMCSACRVQLPSERVQSLEAGPDIAECPNCKRILIVRLAGGAE